MNGAHRLAAGPRQRWGLVLAGGEGRRLRALTVDRDGHAVPKQFCSLGGRTTLVQDTIDRMRIAIDPLRIAAIVTAAHRPWWPRNLAALEPTLAIEQPSLRGTAAGILLPLLAIAERDPAARLLVMPADHHVEDPLPLLDAAIAALDDIEDDDETTVLLGITPDSDDIEYGWIVPEEIDELGRIRVRTFVEKPPASRIPALVHRGALWNSFVMATSAPALLELFRRRTPALLDAVIAARGTGDLSGAWSMLPLHDFSADLLAGSESSLRLAPVAPCGWTDLGTPARIAELRARKPVVDDGDANVVLLRRSA